MKALVNGAWRTDAQGINRRIVPKGPPLDFGTTAEAVAAL